MEISTIAEPGFIDFTISSVIKIGATLPNTRAEQKTISASATASFRFSFYFKPFFR